MIQNPGADVMTSLKAVAFIKLPSMLVCSVQLAPPGLLPLETAMKFLANQINFWLAALLTTGMLKTVKVQFFLFL